MATTMEAIAADAGVALKTVYVASRPRAACCERCGTSCCRATRTTPRRRAPWYREVMESPIPRASCTWSPETRGRSRSASPVCSGSSATRRRSTPTGRALGLIQSDFHDNQNERREERCIGRRRPAAWPRCQRVRHRHPVDAEPSRSLAAARGPAALDAGGVRAMAGRHLVARSSSVPAGQAQARRGQAGRVRVRRRGSGARRRRRVRAARRPRRR